MARIGGSFAPRLTASLLKAYRAIAATAPPPIADAIGKLCDMGALFIETPDSKKPGQPHPVGMGVIVELEDAEKERIFDVVPWPHEVEMYKLLLDRLPDTRDDIENARLNQESKARGEGGVPIEQKKVTVKLAFGHLVWYAAELAHDREPPTKDRL